MGICAVRTGCAECCTESEHKNVNALEKKWKWILRLDKVEIRWESEHIKAQATKKTAEQMTSRQRCIVEDSVVADAYAKPCADSDGDVMAEAVASDYKQERANAESMQLCMPHHLSASVDQ